MTDFAKLMPDVARALLGEPNAKLTKGDKWRYRNKGSLSVDVKKGQWNDFEAGQGGGVLELVEVERQTDRAGAIQWLKDNGHLPESPTRRVGRFKRRSARPTRQRRTRAERPRTAQKPKPDKEKSDMQIFAQKLWAQAEAIGNNAEHPFWRWATVGDKPGVLHPYCRVPPAIRWTRYRGGAVVAGVFPLNAWSKDGQPFGLPVAVQALAIDQGGENRFCLGEHRDLRRCSYGPISEGVFALGDPTSERVNIVEGVADALAVYSREPGAVLATLGTNAKLANMPDVIDWLCTRETWLYPDNDENKASEQGTAALIDCIMVKNPDAKVFRFNLKAVGDDPGKWAEKTPFPNIERYDFEEKSGQFFDGGLSWGEADRLAIQHLTGESSNE